MESRHGKEGAVLVRGGGAILVRGPSGGGSPGKGGLHWGGGQSWVRGGSCGRQVVLAAGSSRRKHSLRVSGVRVGAASRLSVLVPLENN